MPNPGVFGFPHRARRGAGGGVQLPSGASDHDLFELVGGELSRIPISAGKLLKAKDDGSGYEFVSPASGGGGGSQVTVDTFANRPGSPAAGDRFIPTDGPLEQVYDGSAWLNLIPGGRPVSPPPAASNWGWTNQGSATIADAAGTLLYTFAGATSEWRLARIAYPSAPFRIEACFAVHANQANAQWMGINITDGTKYVTNGLAGNASSTVKGYTRWSTASAFNGHILGVLPEYDFLYGPFVWLSFEDDGTDRMMGISADGVEWIEHVTEGNTNYLTPTHIGFGAYLGSASLHPARVRLVGWEQS